MSDLAEYRDIKARHTGNGHAAEGSIEPPLPFNPAILDGIPVPERQWLVAGWIPMAHATGLYGAGGEGKTLLAQMLATSCAVNATWLGLPVRQCRSLLFFCINQYIFSDLGSSLFTKLAT